MSELQTRVEQMRQIESARRRVQAEQTRSILADAGLLAFAEEARELFGAKLTFARFGDVVIGTEPERGYTDFVLLDMENKRAAETAAKASKSVQATSGRNRRKNGTSEGAIALVVVF